MNSILKLEPKVVQFENMHQNQNYEIYKIELTPAPPKKLPSVKTTTGGSLKGKEPTNTG